MGDELQVGFGGQTAGGELERKACCEPLLGFNVLQNKSGISIILKYNCFF